MAHPADDGSSKSSSFAKPSPSFSGGVVVKGTNNGTYYDDVSSSTNLPSSTSSLNNNELMDDYGENESVTSTASSTRLSTGSLDSVDKYFDSQEADADSTSPPTMNLSSSLYHMVNGREKSYSATTTKGSVPGGDSSFMHSAASSFKESPWKGSTGGISTTTLLSSDRTPGDVGLKNLTNTCFMNSGLQCLAHTASLVEFFLKLDLKAVVSGSSPHDLVKAFQDFMKYVWFGTSREPLSLSDFRNKLGELHPQFKDGRQHDCQEFLALLLDTLHEELKKLGSSPSPPLLPQKSIAGGEKKRVRSYHGNIRYLSKLRGEENYGANVGAKFLGREGGGGGGGGRGGIVCAQSSNGGNRGSELQFSASLSLKKRSQEETSPLRSLKRFKSLPDGSSSGGESESEKSSTPTTSVKIEKNENISPKAQSSSSVSVKNERDETISVKKEKNNEEEMEVDGGGSEVERVTQGVSELEIAALKADEYWTKHMAENNSVVASTFQGVFKSTVICGECNFVSVTYEPFMYLSVPIPMVLPRTLTVTFMSAKMMDKSPTKVTVKLQSDEKVRRLKELVASEIPGLEINEGNADEFVVAEVVNNNIGRRVDDDVEISYLNDNNRNIYMFELNDNFVEMYGRGTNYSSLHGLFASNIFQAPFQNKTSAELTPSTYIDENWDEDEEVPPLVLLPSPSPLLLTSNQAPIPLPPPPPQTTYGPHSSNTNTPPQTTFGPHSSSPNINTPPPQTQATYGPHSSSININTPQTTFGPHSSFDSSSTSINTPPQTTYGPHSSSTPPPTITNSTFSTTTSSTYATASTNAMNSANATTTTTLPLVESNGCSTSSNVNVVKEGDDYDKENGYKMESSGRGNVASMPCLICLEELPVSLLRQHKNCGAICCQECLQRYLDFSKKASGESGENGTLFKCPTCLIEMSLRDEFVEFESEKESGLSLVSLLFRRPIDTNNNSGRLFGPPLVVRLPHSLPGATLHAFIASLNPFPHLTYRLSTVFGDGLRCSQCIYSDGCDGCEIPDDGVEVTLPLGSSLALSYHSISEEEVRGFEPPDMATASTSLSSSSFTRTEPLVDIHDCLRSFSEVEHLDEKNPWFCPNCKKNQCATKSISICRFPDYLIIYLKRFVFANNASLKLNNKLRFPLNNLDMRPYISPEAKNKSNDVYDLYSCVCHYGGLNAGHYVAFSKNPITGTFNNFNDDRVTEQTPGENDYSSAYVLFFQRKGLEYEIPKRNESNMIRVIPSAALPLNLGPFHSPLPLPPPPSSSSSLIPPPPQNDTKLMRSCGDISSSGIQNEGEADSSNEKEGSSSTDDGFDGSYDEGCGDIAPSSTTHESYIS